jgi:REP element-mobilizing transposase RayT
MPRRLRIHVPGGFYHVTLRGNHQRKIFQSDTDAALLDEIVERAVEKYRARIHAYCWMSNHIHLLVQVGVDPLAAFMRQIASEFARAMQRKMDTTGHYFERRYHATLVDVECYLKEVVRYIHLNPVTAGIVLHPREYSWCSHSDYSQPNGRQWVTTDFVLQVFGSTRACAVAAYSAFLEKRDVCEWESKLEFGGRAADVLGDDAFIARARASAIRAKDWQDLEGLVGEACRRFMIHEDKLGSPIRDPFLARVRAWIAIQARERGIATLSAVARRVNRTEATLRQAIRDLPPDFE